MASDLDSESDNEGASVRGESSQVKGANMTPMEKELLLDLINQRKEVLENKSKNFGSTDVKKKAWDSVAAAFNSQPYVSNRSAQKLRTWWNNSKKRAKKNVAKNKREARKTGGGKKPADLNNETLRVMSIVPGQMEPLDNPYDCDNEDLEDNRNLHDVLLNAQNGDEQQGTALDVEKIQPSAHVASTSTSIPTDQTPSNVPNDTSDNNRMGTSRKRKYRDARSSLIDLEYEEHKVRLKTLFIEQESATLQKKLIQQKIEFEADKQKLEKQILEARLLQYQTNFVLEGN